jgi:putative nucleotidyltransferase with HDIG domain
VHALASADGLTVYAVGGTVRDVLLRRELRDMDIAVLGDAMAFARSLAAALDGHFVALNEEQAVARVVLEGGAASHVDISQIPGTLEADLRRRDFTIDALAAPLAGGEIVDVAGGLGDLEARSVRMVSERALDDDPVRLLRAVRIAAELSFEIEPETARAIRERAPRVRDTSAERQRDELARIFAVERAWAALRALDGLGLLDAVLPEVAAGRGVSQPEQFHAYDVLTHNLAAVDALDVMLSAERPADGRAWMWDALWTAFAWRAEELRRYLAVSLAVGRSRLTLLKFGALLHDVAKPQTRSVDANGRVRFLGHADEGASIAAGLMRRLRFSSREIAFVKVLVREHLRPVQLAAVGEVPTRRALYRFHRDAGDALEGVLLLALADAAGARGDAMGIRAWSRQVGYMNGLLVRLQGEEGIVRAPRLLTGHDIMSEFGLAEGPRIGSLLEAVREAEAIAGVRDRQGALAFVRALLDEENSAGA